MIVNPMLKIIFKEIARQSVSYANTPDKERKYMLRLLRIFKEHLTEEEQLFLLKMLFENLSYKNIITDPDNVIQLHNIKLRSYAFIGFIATIIMFIASGLFRTNDSMANLLTAIGNIFKLLSI